ncbi:hypothetical protein L596_004644 [Steinernema carpocapsae]|uniref:Uncharacterized protein n=1 Tax=Steinernema carpocapsae TaxID=34508 RepID=A0A4U8UWG0_STECR|nr:hypothetical protein L596_004644 [Steinernema carpocapsae]
MFSRQSDNMRSKKSLANSRNSKKAQETRQEIAEAEKRKLKCDFEGLQDAFAKLEEKHIESQKEYIHLKKENTMLVEDNAKLKKENDVEETGAAGAGGLLQLSLVELLVLSSSF